MCFHVEYKNRNVPRETLKRSEIILERNSEIWIYDKAPFENSFSDVIKFESKKEQLDFFENSEMLNEIYHANDYAFVKRTNDIKIKGNFNKYEHATYMRFLNLYIAHLK